MKMILYICTKNNTFKGHGKNSVGKIVNPNIPPNDSNINKMCCEPIKLTDGKLYKEIVGSLIFAMITARSDLCFIVTKLSQYMCEPVATLAYFCYSWPPPALCQLQFPTHGPWTQSKSSHLLLRDSPLYSTDWQTYLAWCFFFFCFFFCKQYSIEDVHYYDEKNMFIRIKKLMTIYTDTASSFNFA